MRYVLSAALEQAPIWSALWSKMEGLPICRAHGALHSFLPGFAFAALLSVCDGGPRPPVSMDAEMGQRIRAYSVGIGYQAGQELRATGMLTPYAGIILTNDHAIPGAKSTKITLDGKEFHEARVIARNAELDLALLKVENGEFSAELPELATSPRAGMPVVAFGSAFGLHRSFLQGYVSHERRVGLRGQTKGTHYIQVQSITFPGMSGAPVFTLQGEWIGINRAAYGYTTTTGTGLLIPASRVHQWMEETLPEKQ